MEFKDETFLELTVGRFCSVLCECLCAEEEERTATVTATQSKKKKKMIWKNCVEKNKTWMSEIVGGGKRRIKKKMKSW